jgi:hypothetical protein
MLVGMVGLLGRSRAVAMGKGPVDNNALFYPGSIRVSH